MSKPPSKTPPQVTPSKLKRRLMRATVFYAVNPTSIDLSLHLAIDAMGASFRD